MGRLVLSRLLTIASWVLVVALCTLAATVLGLRLAGWQPLVVLTGSMEPALARGDLLLVSHEPVRAVRAGDVVTFARPRHPGQTMTHRVVAVRPAPNGRLAVTTRGDANPAPERWSIPADGTVGKLRMRLAGAGTLAAPLRGELSRGAAVIAVTALLAAIALRAIWHPTARRSAP